MKNKIIFLIALNLIGCNKRNEFNMLSKRLKLSFSLQPKLLSPKYLNNRFNKFFYYKKPKREFQNNKPLERFYEPCPLFDTSILPILSYSIMYTNKLGILSLLAEKSYSLEEISNYCNIDSNALYSLLNVLISANYLKIRNKKYIIPRNIKKYFLKNGKESLINIINFNMLQYDMIKNLSNYINIGKKTELHDILKNKEEWEMYQLAMYDLSKLVIKDVIAEIPVNKSTNRVLDLAGGHGLFGASIVKKNKMRETIVLDLSKAISIVEQKFKSPNIKYISCNILNEDFNILCDVIFIGNVLHHFSKEEILVILKKSKKCLVDKGTIAIFQSMKTSSNEKEDLSISSMQLFFELMSKGTLHYESEYFELLSECDFKNIKSIDFDSSLYFLQSPNFKLIIAQN